MQGDKIVYSLGDLTWGHFQKLIYPKQIDQYQYLQS